ncbi:MAG: hypothetical protein GXP14_07325 [Gammaproteobacteria bacterium]|nr:hypothetical protein [Gammaproteobacteria bacterium]
MTREAEFNSILHEMRRNYPHSPTTFGICCVEGCKNHARGSGKCAYCCEEEMATVLNSSELAGQIHTATRKTAELISNAIEKILEAQSINEN